MPNSREYFSGLVTGQIAAKKDAFDLVINTHWAFQSATVFTRKHWSI